MFEETPEQRQIRRRAAEAPGPTLDADDLRAGTVTVSLAKMEDRRTPRDPVRSASPQPHGKRFWGFFG